MNFRNRISYLFVLIALLAISCNDSKPKQKTKPFGNKSLLVSENGRYLETGDGKPFFWLGDTAWLLFGRLTREEANTYLEDRKEKGYTVIQAMLLHDVPARNVYLDTSVVGKDVSKIKVTPGNTFGKGREYDYWDHVDYIIDKAAEKGLYMALVPVWGTNVKEGKVKEPEARKYAEFLAKRYRNKWNIIWMNGGDIKGSDKPEVWKAIGKALRANDPNHLITFHPRGRTKSSEWFEKADWMDFNMIQSGHRRYEQDSTKNEKWHYGEDNWKYIQDDYKLTPAKPTIDGEPSYEDIPQGLHDSLQPRWQANDVRRYGYWSVFAGAFGYTYGHNSVMQMYKFTDRKPAYAPHGEWSTALNAPGASQMQYLKNLMLSRSYFDRVPDQSIIAGKNGDKYNRLMATRGDSFVMVYTYTGGEIKVNMEKIPGAKVKASWFDPRTGKATVIGEVDNKSIQTFKAPGKQENGNDWVLILDKI